MCTKRETENLARTMDFVNGKISFDKYVNMISETSSERNPVMTYAKDLIGTVIDELKDCVRKK